MLTQLHIDTRLPVWHALSDLFLDTELLEDDYRRIAAVLRSSGYGLKELRSILFDEVGPAFAFNMMGTAGEWNSWSAEEVRQIMCRSLEQRSTLATWARRKVIDRYLTEMWSRLEPLVVST